MDDTPQPIAAPLSFPRRRRRLWPRVLIAGVVVVIVLPVAAAGAFFLSFDPNAYKGQIEAAAAQATGRQVTIAGSLAVKLSLIPTITAQDVTVANIPGGSAPAMVQVASIETRIALLPLLHHAIDIEALVLRHPTILMERTKDGMPNWVFTPAPTPIPETPGNEKATPPVTVDTGHGAWQVSLSRLDITDGTLTWRDLATGESDSLAIKTARLTAETTGDQKPATAPLALSADTVWQGQAVTLKGRTGTAAALMGDAGAQGPWPVDLTLAAAGAAVTLKGGVTDPRRMQGYDLTLNGTVPALEALTPLLPPGLLPAGTSLPPVHGVTLAATIADAGQGRPKFTNLSLQAQNSDLGSLLPGLALDSLSVMTPALDQPVTVNLLGERHGLSFTLSGSTGPIATLMPPPAATPAAALAAQPAAPKPAPAPLPVDLMLTAAQSNLHLQGAIQNPLALHGLHLALTAAIAKLDVLGPLFGTSLPPIVSLNGSAQLADGPQGLGQGVTLTALNLTAPEGDLEGAISADYAKRLTILATLRSARLDLDGMTNAMRAAAPQAQAAPAAPPPAAPATPGTPAGKHLIPDLPLPVALLRSFDGSAKLAFASLKLGGAEYRALVATATLENGVFSLAPSSVVVPGGQLLAAGNINAQGPVPHTTFAMQAQNLAVAPLLQALQIPVAARGLVQVFANLTADGATTRAMAADVNGAFGLAAVNGTIDGRALAALLAPAVHAAGVVPTNLLSRAGDVPLYCLALRLNATHGHADVGAMVLDTSALLLQGTGSLDFGQERLALALSPELYLGEMDLTVPLTVGGSVLAPQIGKVGKVVINQEAGNGAQGLNGLFQSIIGSGRKAARGPSPVCGPALALARNGLPGPDPSNGGSDAGILQKPMNLFHQLLNGQ
ncbi:MAG TPA: AsmA family protein [Acidisoma sp.]|uniref:AsmA family protein n=1 Tax=Acidisoma sp. TaxID=1872115 RepID=UPI002BB6D165|nr:AsmA family protein [Acidisoma sp.]HTI00361.1 AsmA family protein [Acidisoma sp.]